MDQVDSDKAILAVDVMSGDFPYPDNLAKEINNLNTKFSISSGTVRIRANDSITEGKNLKSVDQKEGVAEWAKKEYMKYASEQLVCSITPDGKIGSVYFGEEGRVRLTHSGGPKSEKHKNRKTTQFNINMDEAYGMFVSYCAEEKIKLNADHFNQFLAEVLQNISIKDLPKWLTIKKINKVSDAAEEPNETTLFEVFENLQGKLKGWHPSRGTAVNLTVSKQTVSVIKKAIQVMEKADKEKREQLKGVDVPEIMYAYWNNRAFYQVIQKLDPKFAEKVRSDTEIAKDLAKMSTDQIKKYSEKLAKRKNK